MASPLRRELGVGDAVVIGLGSMIGAGIFAAIGPAAREAGVGMLVGLAVAAAVAYCNATSSAQLAARHPESGGTYVYGRERLGPFWGYLAGWGFVVGKTASCAAMALTFGTYVAPGAARPVAVLAVVALTAVNYTGVRKTARLTRVLVGTVVAVLAAITAACLLGPDATTAGLQGWDEVRLGGVLRSAGLLFFAFAGYARIATLGEEVRDPERTIPRAIPLALGLVLGVYAAVLVAALVAAGPERLAAADAPLVTAVRASGAEWAAPLVRIGAAIGAAGVLLSLIAGVSRTALAMARDAHLPGALAAVHPRYGVPHRAEMAVGAAVIVLVVLVDLRDAIGFSSFAVLGYYAIANASAYRMGPDERRWPRGLTLVGGAGCALLALSLPFAAVVSGAAVLAAGALVWIVRHR